MADQPPQQGRGRSRGRGRGEKGRARQMRDAEVPRPGQQSAGHQPQLPQQPYQQRQQQQFQPAPMPTKPAWGRARGQQQQPQGVPPVAPPPGQAPGKGQKAQAMGGAGRTARRGTSRAVESRVGDVEKGVQQMALESQGAVGGAPAPGAQQQMRGTQEEGMRDNREPRNYQEFLDDRYGSKTFRSKELIDKRGVTGTPCTVRGNYFKMHVPEDWKLYQYHVDFMPPCEGTKMRKALLYSHDQLLGPVKAFDGMILFLPHRLEHDEMVVHSNRRSDNTNIKITIKLTCELVGITPATLQVMNIIWKKIMGIMQLQPINHHYFDMQHKFNVPNHKMEVIPGYQTSILYYERDTLLDIDLTHRFLRSTTVLDLLYQLHRNTPPNKDFYTVALKEIVGLVVMTRYNDKNYTVSDIDWDGRVTDTFDKGGNAISYKNYYNAQYDIQIRDLEQPLLVIKSKGKDVRAGKGNFIRLVPEISYITGLSDLKKDKYVMRDLASQTRVGPDQRAKKLTRFLNDVTAKPEVTRELRNWNLKLDSQLVQVQARQLPKEELNMLDPRNCEQDAKLKYDQNVADWSRDMRGKLMRLPISLERKKWVFVFPGSCRGNAHNLLRTLCNVGPPLGMNLGEPLIVEVENVRNDTYYNALRAAVEVPHTKMVVCVLPNDVKDRYDAIKKFCCIDVPVPSQCVLDKTLKKKERLMSVATKIAIQMNCKLGGVVWNVHIPLPTTMIIGLDTYHDSSRRGRSVGAVVASITRDHCRYFSTCVFQMTHQELANQLEGCVTACMRAYASQNEDRVPDKVVVYRDGVGDGQLNLVADHEIPQIKRAIGNSKLTFVVVKKRTNARFFLETREGGYRGGAYGNPQPGTVIDDVATKKDWFDFFLVSQSVREGTVSPTHYNVILNEVNLQPDHMQKLSYKLCHLYYNWQGTIRVPAPCMYAHKMAFLVGQSLHQEPSGALSRHLFYL